MQITQVNGPANGVVQQQNPEAGYGRHRAARIPHGVPGLLGTSIVQLILGGLTTGLGVAAIFVENAWYDSGWAVWTGTLFFVVTGILGVIPTCINRNKCLIIAFLVMSILSSVFAGALLIGSAIGAAEESDQPSCNHGWGCTYNWQSRFAVDMLLVAVSLAELVFSIIGSALTCYGLSTYMPNTPDTEMQVRYVTQQQQMQQPGTQFVPVITTQQPQPQPQPQPQQQQPYQMQAAPVAAPVKGAYLVSSPYAGQGLYPTQQLGVATQQLGVATQQVGLPPQYYGRTTPLLDVSQQHSGRSTPQMVYVQQPAVVPVVVPPQPNVVPQPQVGLQTVQASFQQSGVPAQQGGGSQQVEVGSQQVGIGSQQAGIGSQQGGLISSQQVGIGSQQGGFGTQQAGIGSQQVGIGSDQGGLGSPQVGNGFQPIGVGSQPVGIGSPQVGIGSPQAGVAPQEMASQPEGMAADQPATFQGSDEKETVEDQEVKELQLGGDEQYRDDKLLLADTD